MSNYILTSNGELYHYGIKGQKWGVRRFQNKDGSLKPAGKKRLRKQPQMYEPGSLTKIPSVRKADKMIMNDVRAYKKSLKGQGVMVREGKLGERRKETGLQIKRDSQKLRAEKKANKVLQKASNSYFRARDYQKIGNKKYAEAATKNAERNIQKAKKMLDKVGSTRTDRLYGMANTKNGYAWWENYGYATY